MCGSDSALALKNNVNTYEGGLRPATLLKRDLNTYFPVKLQNFQEHLF